MCLRLLRLRVTGLRALFVCVKHGPDSVQNKFISAGDDIRPSAFWTCLANTSMGLESVFEDE